MDGGDERRRGDSEGSVECGEEGGVHDRGRGYRLGGLEQGYGLLGLLGSVFKRQRVFREVGVDGQLKGQVPP
jgi:hypothetical protein